MDIIGAIIIGVHARAPGEVITVGAHENVAHTIIKYPVP